MTLACPPLFPEIAKDLHVGMDSALNLSMAFALSVGVAMILGGILVDKAGITAGLVVALLFGCIPGILMPLIGHSYGVVLILRVLQGGVAITFSVIGPILALWFPPKEHGLAGGILMSCISAGAAVGVFASPAVYSIVGSWQMTVAILSMPGIVGIIVALLFTRRKPSPKVVEALMAIMKSGAEDLTYKKIFTSPLMWIGTVVTLCNAWGIYGLYNIVPPYLASPAPMGLGLEPMLVGKLCIGLTIVGLPAFILGGMFFDKVAKGNHRPGMIIGFVMTGIFTFLLLQPFVYQNTSLLAVCLIIAGWGMSFQAPSISAFITMNYPPRFAGSLMGWWFGFGTFAGGAMGTYIAGLSTARLGSFYWALTPVSLIMCLGFVVQFFMRPRGHKV
jgi:MFS family permease